MRIVLDTNVFVSGVFFGGQPGRILTAWRDKMVRLVLSHEILEEYIEVLYRLEKLYPPIEAEPVIELILAGSEIIPAVPLEKPVSCDPDDGKFIACALASKAKVIVSGDKHLLSLKRFQDIDILSPSEFVQKYL
ncbi:MAG: putative toxin-antitoxin system toxin component, PIN family [bacterium]|nr:putative toxin-antitoxin system toxin component, PIN family [bacterium]